MEIMQELGRAIVGEKNFPQAAQKVCSTLRRKLPHYSWVGVYLVNGDKLKLAAWDGPGPTEHVEIAVGRGLCGAAARTRETVLVNDVGKDPRYLQCFAGTKSEIVVPILQGGRCLGEIDVDSDRLAAFNALDRLFLEWLADLLAEKLSARGQA
jgi:GAF domain-containing protein